MGWAFAGARMGAMQFENFAGIAAFLQVTLRNLPAGRRRGDGEYGYNIF